MSKLQFLIGILLFQFSLLYGQTKEITGKVIDAKDQSPLGGVTITLKGSKGVAQTGTDGTFTIKVSAKATALHLTYIGYENKDVEIDALTGSAVITLQQSSKALSEVVVVGYGKALKKDLTGSISKLASKEIENFPAPSFESAIQGKAPGVVVTSGSGKLGQAIQVSIRGISSISASSQPLYVVDGLPITSTSVSDGTNDDTNPLADINPNDIESVEVLKDASAAAIYGARASNGVVLITTKKGRNGQKTTIELNVSHGVSNPARKLHFLNAKQYVGLMQQSAVNDGTYDFNNQISGYNTVDDAINDYFTSIYQPILDQYSLGTDWRNQAVNTNWQDALYNKNAPNDQINLSATGGNDKTRFFISGFYNTQQAIVINNTFSRYGTRFNIDHNATDKLVFGLNLAIDRSQLNRVTNDDAFSTPGQLVAQLPISPYLDPATGLPNNQTLYPSGIYDALYDYDHQITYRTIGNAYGNYKILPTLSFQSEFGADILNLTENEFAGKESQDGNGVGYGATVISQSVSFNTNNYFTFTPHIGENSKLNAVLGMSYLQNDYQHGYAQGNNYPSDAVKNLSGATSITGASITNTRYTFLSYFLRASYAYKERYLLSLSGRIDGSSRFGPSSKYGVFPAASAGWVISDEDFMKDSKALSFLKLRASYGLTGNSEIGEQQFRSLYTVANYPNLPGFVPTQLANPDLKWEKSRQFDIGLDFGFLKNRLTGEFDFYTKHTTDLLLNTNIPYTTGYASIYRNAGTLDNKGLELALTSKNIDGAFKWTTTINIGYNKNKIGDIKGQIIESADGLQRAVEGQPIGVFYMQKLIGVDPQTGDALYADAQGKPTNDYTQAARMVVGKYTPDYTGGITNTFSYKGFDLSVFFYFVTGNNIYNAAGRFMSDGFYNGWDNQTTDMLKSWKKPGDITNIPRTGYYWGSGTSNSSEWLYKGDYLRLKNLTIGYTFPKSFTSALKISSARFYVSGINLLTFTKYPGDPEVNTNVVNNIAGGEDFYTIPQPKTITFGLNIKF
ncbi:MAG: TonB-dependent receptor [Bacteroidetes bacterium]|nr:TonB-dependent receptor [Bacteroidota bacterium]